VSDAPKAYRFPDGFVWGASTSAYQVEGSPLADGAGPSIQDGWAHAPGNVSDGSNADVAADHYHRYREDIAIMGKLGLGAYQFSINWARVLPEGTGKVNQRGLDFYDSLVDSLLEAGVAPVPLLYVWELPAVLQDRGGWANRDAADWFAEYVGVIFERLGDRPTHWLTMCEPSSIAHHGYIAGDLAPGLQDLRAGLRAAHHVSLAHGRAVEAFRATGAKGLIGCHVTSVDAQPATDSEEDAAAAQRVMEYFTALYIDPILRGEYPAGMVERFADSWPSIADGDMATISTPIDFIGVTYYSGFVVADGASGQEAGRAAGGELNAGPSNGLNALLDMRLVDSGLPKTGGPGFSWAINPTGIGRVLRWLRDRYANFPAYVTENGATYPDVLVDGRVADPARIAFIRDHLIVAHEAIEDGVDLRGWFVWSLLDTWEYMVGRTARFGLVHVDYDTQRRTIKDSGWWYRDVMAAGGFEA
jgi:beta-glucosidase